MTEHDEGHGHSHGGIDPGLLRSRDAMHALLVSLVVLGVTAVFQIVVVVVSGSVALLADTVHNAGDALTAVPLGVAFLLLRRGRTRRLTYGYGRAEDFAGLAVVAIILFSAVYAAYEAIDRLVHPSPPGYLLATAIAGVVGFIGNEWVAVFGCAPAGGSAPRRSSPTGTTRGSTASPASRWSPGSSAWPWASISPTRSRAC